MLATASDPEAGEGLLRPSQEHHPRRPQAVEKAGQYAYRDRKVNKRNFRALWIQRINAAVRAARPDLWRFMHGLKLAGVELDRKVLADIAMHEPATFQKSGRNRHRTAATA